MRKNEKGSKQPGHYLKRPCRSNENESLDALDNEIKEIEMILLNYEQRRCNLLEAMGLGEFKKDEVLDRLNNIKHLRQEDDVR